jgi:secreted PhoX family phosphatase
MSHPFDAARRQWLQGSAGVAVSTWLAPLAAQAAAAARPVLGFAAVDFSATAPLVVPTGYTARVLYRWGDATGLAQGQPAFKPDASNSAAEQALQAGMHHDGMHYFPISAQRGLLALNHEYTDEGLLHTDGTHHWSAEKVAKSMAAHGVSVIEVRRSGPGQPWQVQQPSPYARRITASTPLRIAGPAAGHALMRTAADPQGTQVLGTLANCANGATPWGTYLTCEENFHSYFQSPDQPDAHQQRWGLAANSNWLHWSDFEERFDTRRHPNEFNRFGWVVEIDPWDPQSVPVKRTALGRAAHEGAACAVAASQRVVVLMGEDAAFERIYKFVSRDAVQPGTDAAARRANRELLDHGTLYAARLDADGTGRWLPLVHGQGPLIAANGFADQGEVLIKARQASDALGATPMDRPEWSAIDPVSGAMYVTLTNNGARGLPGHPGPDAANPRGPNPMGEIVRLRHPQGLDALAFEWDLYVLAGDARNSAPEARGQVHGDAFGSPDGLVIDPRGLMWIHTDVSSSVLGKAGGPYAQLPRNQLLVCDARAAGSPQIRRFLIGPSGSEITGASFTADARTMFLNIQHPGENAQERSEPGAAFAHAWPDPGVRWRSATVVITKDDGGPIGA